MRSKPLSHTTAVLAVIVSLLAATPSGAFDWPWSCDDKCVAKDQVVKRAAEEFDQLRVQIEAERKDDPHRKTYINQINATQKRFESRAKTVLQREKYNEWEFEYIGQRVTHVIIPAMQKAVAASAYTPVADREAVFKKSAEQSLQNDEKFNEQFVAQNFTRMIAQTTQQTGERVSAAAADTAGTIRGTVTDANRDSSDPNVGSAASGSPRQIARGMLQLSDVVRLAEASAKYAVRPTDPSTPDGPAGGAGPGSGAGPRPRPWRPGGSASGGTGTGSGSGSSPNSPGSAIEAISSPQGVSQLYANNGIQALESRNFAEAYAMSQQALALDAANRSAMEVYQAVKGRVDAASHGAAGVGAAKAGAAALNPSGSDPGGVGGAASPSASMSAIAATGAARLAVDHAMSGAKNAMKLGDAQSSLEILNKALEQNPASSALLNLRSQTYGHLGRREEALRDAVAGLSITPGNLPLLNSLARAQNRAHLYKEALATADQMIAADPGSAWGYANRAHARGGLGDKAGMMADIEMAARLDPIFQRAAADAAQLQLPSDADILFMFPGERGQRAAPAPAPEGRGRSFSVVVGAGIVGGLLLALGLLSTVLAPLKNTVVSVFTKANRTGPAVTQAVAPAQPAPAAVSGLIRGQYEVSRKIGEGGMGMVYEGTDRSLGRRVAIKKMRDELRLNARERDRFIIEAKTVASLHHPNIVDIYAIAEEGDDVYLVFEFVDGKTVHDLVQGKGRLAPAESVRVARAMGDALTYAHAHGVIHRDMKPSNVMVTSAGQIKVMDFGIARMAKDALTRYSMTNTVVGTPPYMAPEQEQGVVRKESDVYSLAVCAYEMMTGKMPFIGIGAGMLMNKINMSYIPPSRAIAGLPEALDEVFTTAFQADPDRRYRTPQEFVAALAAASDGSRSKTA